MQDAVFINMSAAERIRSKVRSMAIRMCIGGSVRVLPHYEHRSLKGFKVRWTDSITGNSFNVSEEMMA